MPPNNMKRQDAPLRNGISQNRLHYVGGDNPSDLTVSDVTLGAANSDKDSVFKKSGARVRKQYTHQSIRIN